MPLHRYQCSTCGELQEHLRHSAEDSPEHCGEPMVKRMPRRVVGRVEGSEQARGADRREQQERQAVMIKQLRANEHAPAARASSPVDIPAASWSGPARSRAELDARWRDTTEAMATWQANSLAADGVDYGEAKRKAERHQQQISARGDAQSST